MIKEIIKETRSHRSFEREKIDGKNLLEMVNAGRIAGATRNIQAIKYIIVNEGEIAEKLFPELRWAGYIEWNPEYVERPAAYIIMCYDKQYPMLEKYFYFDMGIASQNIMLTAKEMGYGGCVLGAFDATKVSEIISLDTEKYSLEIIIALGKPKDKVELVECKNNDIKYYREKGIHYVPKRRLEDIIIK